MNTQQARRYVLVTGIVFGLISLAHVARVALEGLHVLRNPWFGFSTVLAVALCAWALRLLTAAKTGSD